MERKEMIEALKNILYSDLNLSAGTKQALSSAIAEAELMEKVASGGVGKRFCGVKNSDCSECRVVDCEDRSFNEAIDLCNAHWAEKMRGIEEVIENNLIDFIKCEAEVKFLGIKVAEKTDSFDMRKWSKETAQKIAQSLINHLTER